MTIHNLLNGETVKMIQVNIIKEISPTQFIVGDITGIAIMIVEEEVVYKKQIEVGKGLKIVKPQKINDTTISCHPKFSPMKTKSKEIIIDYTML